MDQAWYLTAEMQMFLFTPAILVPHYWIGINRGPKMALLYSALYPMLSTFCTLVLSITNEWEIVGLVE